MKYRVIQSNKNFELREEQVRGQNSKKTRRMYRLRYLGWVTPDVIERMNRLIDPDANRGIRHLKRFRSHERALQAFMTLTLAWPVDKSQN